MKNGFSENVDRTVAKTNRMEFYYFFCISSFGIRVIMGNFGRYRLRVLASSLA